MFFYFSNKNTTNFKTKLNFQIPIKKISTKLKLFRKNPS